MMVAAGIALPYVVHAVGASPRVLLPMHFPILIAGVLLSPLYAAMVGLVTPAISMGLTGLPTSAQVMRMMPELATYALATSLMLRALPRIPGLPEKIGRLLAVAFAMLTGMIAGRLVYVLFYVWTIGPESTSFFSAVLLAPAIPGIISQLILCPLIADRIQRSL
jgi:hypothetical protein